MAGFQAGDAVYGECRGACAESASASSDRISHKPSRLTFQQAAAVPTSACAALQGLRDQANVRPGQKVLINGASGEVGPFAVMSRKEGTMAEKKTKIVGEAEVLANIAAMPEPDRVVAERLHAMIKANAPVLSPRLWYGMPAYAGDGHVICFFQSADKFKTRYATLGFQHEANLDEGAMWPVAFAVKELTAVEEAKIVELVKKAVS